MSIDVQAKTVVVTRHPALVAYLRKIGLIGADAHVISHATPEDVAGKDVIGVLPLRLATLADIERYAGSPATYIVNKK